MQEEAEHKIDQQRKNHRKRNQNNLVPVTKHVAQEKCNQYCGNDKADLFQDRPPNQQQSDADHRADRTDIVILRGLFNSAAILADLQIFECLHQQAAHAADQRANSGKVGEQPWRNRSLRRQTYPDLAGNTGNNRYTK